jgi:hypothetical protein
MPSAMQSGKARDRKAGRRSHLRLRAHEPGRVASTAYRNTNLITGILPADTSEAASDRFYRGDKVCLEDYVPGRV